MPHSTLSPLEDLNYTPVHQPIGTLAPDVVERWGPYSQIRWFDRFRYPRGHAESAPAQYWDRFYCESAQHRGLHCQSCIDDQQGGWDPWEADWCCCKATRGYDGEGRALRKGKGADHA
jgi:hypothetical protein